MKRLFYILLLLTISVQAGFAQDNPERSERIKALKVSFLTSKLDLSPEQASKFWPVYNKYWDEVKSVRRNFYQRYKDANGGTMDKAEARKFVDDNLEYQEKVIEIKKKYKDEFLKVISAQQLAAMYQAERDFKTMLLEKLRER